MKLSGNKILITGGATGIGSGLTQRFIQENNTVIICGRRESALKEAAERFPSVITRACDLSIAGERESLFNWIAKEHNDLNVLVNNAGIQQWMSVTDNNFFQRAKDEISINIEAPLHLTSLFLGFKFINYGYQCYFRISLFTSCKSPRLLCIKGLSTFFHSFTPPYAQIKRDRGDRINSACPEYRSRR